DRVVGLQSSALSLVGCVRALVLDFDEIGAPELRQALDALRSRIELDVELDTAVDDVHVRTLELAQRQRDHLERRDSELRRIIDVLTEGLAGITAGAAAYHRQILDTGTRFEAASRLSDLVKVRAAITTEVSTLRTAVAERQASDGKVTAALRAEVEQLRSKVDEATREARTDKLTGAANRAALDAELEERCEAAAAGHVKFAILLADVDHFKAVNDTYGHAVGDRVLQGLVGFLRDRVRREDMIARWGGEEFAIVLAGASARTAFAKAKQLVSALAPCEWRVDGDRTLRFSISMGVTAWRPGDTAAQIIERSDAALYEAKRSGRNRAARR
ncbi:MAG TPA: diguanylate cyclase, partial [Kofleriaceae bacterium]|nr:diguanylate cyclase [Kofleriaceae bacterium]